MKILDIKFWNFLHSTNYPLIRKATYRIFTVLCSKLPCFNLSIFNLFIFLLKVLIEQHLENLSSSILGIFNEKDPTTHQEMWEAVLTFMKSIIIDIKNYIKKYLFSLSSKLGLCKSKKTSIS